MKVLLLNQAFYPDRITGPLNIRQRPTCRAEPPDCGCATPERRMGTQQSTVDSRSPGQIAKAIVKVNKTPELRRAGLRALWKLYCAPQHSVARAELENEFGLLEDWDISAAAAL
jgi:hypothetical protein